MNEPGTPLSKTESPLPKHDTDIYTRLSIAWLAFLFGSVLFAVFGIFSKQNIFLLAIITGIGAIAALWKLRPSKELVTIGGFALLATLVLLYNSFPSVFSGRDQGSYANAAIHLSDSGSLKTHSPVSDAFFELYHFELYGIGKALNFPGFFYGTDGALITQFPIGYIAWLASFFSLVGITGLSLANAVTFFLSLITLFLLLRRFLSFPFAAGGLAVTTLSFPLVWISGITLSENLALALFLLTAFHLTMFIQTPERRSWWISIFGSAFLFLTRIEGIAIIAGALLLPFCFPASRTFLRQRFLSTFIPSLVFLLLLLGGSLFISLPFYITIGKTIPGALSFFSSEKTGAIESISIFSDLSRNLTLFWTYGMISVLAVAILAVFFLFREKRYYQLIPFFLALPTFVYIVSSHISNDHPWELRRFVFSVWPTLIILSSFGIAHLQESFSKKYPATSLFKPKLFSLFFFGLLILPSLPATVPMLTSADNPHLLSDVETLARRFSDRDLILVDRLASGDPFSLIADPLRTLFKKSSVYFFNPDDLLYLNTDRFDHIYLIVRSGDEARYQDALQEKFSLEESFPYTLRTSTSSRETDPSRLPLRTEETVSGTVFRITPHQSL